MWLSVDLKGISYSKAFENFIESQKGFYYLLLYYCWKCLVKLITGCANDESNERNGILVKGTNNEWSNDNFDSLCVFIMNFTWSIVLKMYVKNALRPAEKITWNWLFASHNAFQWRMLFCFGCEYCCTNEMLIFSETSLFFSELFIWYEYLVICSCYDFVND